MPRTTFRTFASTALGVLASILLVAACTLERGSTTTGGDEGRDASPSSSSDPAAPTDGGAASDPGTGGDSCTVCPKGCFDLKSDPMNCGSCGNRCKTTSTCRDGACVAGPDECDPPCTMGTCKDQVCSVDVQCGAYQGAFACVGTCKGGQCAHVACDELCAKAGKGCLGARLAPVGSSQLCGNAACGTPLDQTYTGCPSGADLTLVCVCEISQ